MIAKAAPLQRDLPQTNPTRPNLAHTHRPTTVDVHSSGPSVPIRTSNDSSHCSLPPDRPSRLSTT